MKRNRDDHTVSLAFYPKVKYYNDTELLNRTPAVRLTSFPDSRGTLRTDSGQRETLIAQSLVFYTPYDVR